MEEQKGEILFKTLHDKLTAKIINNRSWFYEKLRVSDESHDCLKMQEELLGILNCRGVNLNLSMDLTPDNMDVPSDTNKEWQRNEKIYIKRKPAVDWWHICASCCCRISMSDPVAWRVTWPEAVELKAKLWGSLRMTAAIVAAAGLRTLLWDRNKKNA